MQSLKFENPVAVSVGFDTKIAIRTVMDMHRFLTDWPPSRRTSVYSTAAHACEAARQGYLTVEQARRSFVEFARVNDILWTEMDAVLTRKVGHSTHV